MIVLVLIILLATPFVFGAIFTAPSYKGPKTDHFDGKKFLNPSGKSAQGLKGVFKYMRTQKPGKWPEYRKLPFGPTPIDKQEGSKARITFINHSSFLIQVQGANILTDPIWSERCSPVSFAGPKRNRTPGLDFDALPKIDIVLITHNHYDHLDLPSVLKLEAEHQPLFVVPLGVDLYLRKKGISNIKVLDWWEETALGFGMKVCATPANHFSSRGMFDRDQTLWCGFGIHTGEDWIYYVGDTGYSDIFKEIGQRLSPMQSAIIPIGAYQPEWFMSPIHISPQQAVQVHQDLGEPLSIACHFNTFPLADDNAEDPVVELKKAMSDAKISENQFLVLTEGIPHTS
jgi:L-ascorbate metabolism protein UlaG (beta-lactamase superfamily)